MGKILPEQAPLKKWAALMHSIGRKVETRWPQAQVQKDRKKMISPVFLFMRFYRDELWLVDKAQ